MCEAQGCPWSVYRCIGDRHFDGLLDERIIALTNQDGSGDFAAIQQLIAAEPELGVKLDCLTRDTALAARLAAEAALRGCLALGYLPKGVIALRGEGVLRAVDDGLAGDVD